MPKLNKRFIDSLQPQPGRDVVAWDTEMRGFGVRIKPSGTGAFILQYRNAEGRSRRITLGAIGVLTPEQVRTLAREKLVSVTKG